MLILKYNPEIRAKITYEVPLSYGDPQFDKKKLSSYSLYENNTIREVRFSQNRVVKYHFNQENFISSIETYDQSSKLIVALNFEKLEENKSYLKFREFFYSSEVGNHGTLSNVTNEQYSLDFHRVDSFLGYKISAMLFGKDLSMLNEEHYYTYKSGREILSKVLLNAYEMRDNYLDNLTKSILTNGWNLCEDDIARLDKY